VLPSRLLRTASFRLAAFYALLFGASALVLFLVIYFLGAKAMRQQITSGIEGEISFLTEEHRAGGDAQVVDRISRRLASGRHRAMFYLLEDRERRPLAGNLQPMEPHEGWLTIPVRAGEEEPDEQDRQLIALGRVLPDGSYLVVGEDPHGIDEVQDTIVDAFAWGLAVTLILAVAGGALVSARFLRRIDAINRTTNAIIEGNLSDRVPAQGTGDELDRLAENLNRMLDRIQSLMGNVRQVSSDIAHDLRTPLTRLRHRLEAARVESKDGHSPVIDRALEDIDELLAMFSALLRIAQIEAGAHRASFDRVDLSELFRNLAETYAPVADDQGQRLVADVGAGIAVRGDRQLLVQMLANLVENALRHTPRGSTITLSLNDTPQGPRGTVADTGPGIPEEAREKVFRPFYRLEASRSTPGSGLGLAMVAAIAGMHGIEVALAGNEPGLRVTLAFPRAPSASVRQRGAEALKA
jgi:signal transduction histidine kinase